MSLLFRSELSDAEICHLNEKLNNSKSIGTCILWQGQTTPSGYGVVNHTFRGRKFKSKVHRIRFFLGNNCTSLDPTFHVSHLCNQKLCINLNHLSFELADVNNQRKTCFNEGRCFGHKGHQDCLYV